MKQEKTFYLDHAAATPIDPFVIDAMLPYMSDRFYNPSSPYAPAVQVRHEYESAKQRLAHTFGAKGDEIIITAGATESINLAFSLIGHVVTSAIEHDAVLAAARRHEHTIVTPTNHGLIEADAVASAITNQTVLVSVQLANNEIGTIQPLRRIASVVEEIRMSRKKQGDKTPLWLHADASQGFGQIDVNAARLGVDLLTLNSGKMYGPKQVGLLWVKPGVELIAQIVGGGQERGLRSGTENVAGVMGFAMAAELAVKRRNAESARLSLIRNAMQSRFESAIENLIVSGHPKKRLPGSLHVSIPGIDGERIVFGLERRGVLLATGSACAANKGTRSHVLTAIGMSDTAADGSLRITLGKAINETAALEATDMIINEIRNEQERLTHA